MNSAVSKLVLVPDDRPAPPRPGVRRYRLARLALNPRRPPKGERFSHLKRCYD